MEVERFDPARHDLLGQIAHRELLTPQERPAFYRAAADALGDDYLVDVQMPDWPPVKLAPLVLILRLGGDGEPSEWEWWTHETWTGVQPALRAEFHRWTAADGREHSNTSPAPHAAALARELAGDHYAPRRIAYLWHIPEFDPEHHVIIRYWLAEQGGDIADFYLEYVAHWPGGFPVPILDVTDPRVREKPSAGGRRRALRRADLWALEQFMAGRSRWFAAAPESRAAAPRVSPSPPAPLPEEIEPEVESALVPVPDVDHGQQPVVCVVREWTGREPFFRPALLERLPPSFARPDPKRSPLVLRSHGDGAGEVRAWATGLGGGLALNGVRLAMEPWQRGGWRAMLSVDEWRRVRNEDSERLPVPAPSPVPIVTPAPVVVFDSPQQGQSGVAEIVAGAQIYPPHVVIGRASCGSGPSTGVVRRGSDQRLYRDGLDARWRSSVPAAEHGGSGSVCARSGWAKLRLRELRGASPRQFAVAHWRQRDRNRVGRCARVVVLCRWSASTAPRFCSSTHNVIGSSPTHAVSHRPTSTENQQSWAGSVRGCTPSTDTATQCCEIAALGGVDQMSLLTVSQLTLLKDIQDAFGGAFIGNSGNEAQQALFARLLGVLGEAKVTPVLATFAFTGPVDPAISLQTRVTAAQGVWSLSAEGTAAGMTLTGAGDLLNLPNLLPEAWRMMLLRSLYAGSPYQDATSPIGDSSRVTLSIDGDDKRVAFRLAFGIARALQAWGGGTTIPGVAGVAGVQASATLIFAGAKGLKVTLPDRLEVDGITQLLIGTAGNAWSIDVSAVSVASLA